MTVTHRTDTTGHRSWRLASLVALAAVGLALFVIAISSTGTAAHTSAARPPSASTLTPAQPAAPAAAKRKPVTSPATPGPVARTHSAIPQNNGGDGDPDNNGGNDDGDGGI